MPDNVHSIKNFKDSKKLKLYVEHLTVILRVVNLSIKGLDHFQIYLPVHAIITTMKEQKTILDAHLNKYKAILHERGVK